jgi:hypothetical protein
LFYEPARIRGLKLVDACADRRLLVFLLVPAGLAAYHFVDLLG